MSCGGGVKGISGGFIFGVGVGVVLHKYWPTISAKSGPYAETAIKMGKEVLASGRDAVKSKPERFADVIDEIKREEQRDKGKPGKDDE